MAEDAPWAPLYEKNTIVVMNKNLSRYKYYPDGSMRFAEITK